VQLGFQVHEIHVGQSRSRAALVKEYSELALSQRINVGRAEGARTVPLLGGDGGNAGQGQKAHAGKPSREEHRRPQQGFQRVLRQAQQPQQQLQRMAKYIVLVDDADVVFEEDAGFAEWLSELIATALCPVVLTCSSALPFTARQDLESAALELVAPPIFPEAVASALRATLAVEGHRPTHAAGAREWW
jgi:hypothetical protein